MASTKREAIEQREPEDGGRSSEDAASSEDSASSQVSATWEVSASGVRVERETTPAPSGTSPSGTSEDWASIPSARPTSVPDYDVAALAFEMSLRPHALPSLPLDVAVPTRTRAKAPPDLDLRASFLLLHVDGVSSVRAIAQLAALPVPEVLAGFLELTSRGLVQLGGAPLPGGVPVSGARRQAGT